MMRRRKECIITGQPGSQPQAPRILVFQGTVKPALVAVTVVLVACHGLTRAILCPRALMMCCFFFFFLARRPRRCPGSWSSPRHPRHSILQTVPASSLVVAHGPEPGVCSRLPIQACTHRKQQEGARAVQCPFVMSPTARPRRLATPLPSRPAVSCARWPPCMARARPRREESGVNGIWKKCVWLAA